MKSLAEHDPGSLREQLRAWGFPTSHAPRILREFYESDGEPEFSDRQLGNNLRLRLRDEFLPLRSRVIQRHESADGTIKLLIAPEDGGPDSFVHITAVQAAGMQTLDKDQRISYDVETGRNGKASAVNLSAA